VTRVNESLREQPMLSLTGLSFRLDVLTHD